MTKLIIQVPCYNESETLSVAAAALPRRVPGIDIVEWMIIDDGSRDGTAEVAAELGFDHIVHLNGHQGLARAFYRRARGRPGRRCRCHRQHRRRQSIPGRRYSSPGRANSRPRSRDCYRCAGRSAKRNIFSPIKKFLQKAGSWVVRVASNTDTQDAPSGFRAISRDAAMRLHVFGDYTYTLEQIIQAGQNGMRIRSVPVRTNEDLRPSRLVKSTLRYVLRSVATIARIFVIYRPMVLFLPLAALLLVSGFGLGARYLYFIAIGEGAGHVQSVILAVALGGVGIFVGLIGVLADLISTNRKLLERMDWKLHKLEENMQSREPDMVPETDTTKLHQGGRQTVRHGDTRGDSRAATHQHSTVRRVWGGQISPGMGIASSGRRAGPPRKDFKLVW